MPKLTCPCGKGGSITIQGEKAGIYADGKKVPINDIYKHVTMTCNSCDSILEERKKSMTNPTPLEICIGIEIKTPQDIINGWIGASILLYCYKNNLSLADWVSLLPDSFIDECVEKNFSTLSEQLIQDFMQITLYLNCMKYKTWSRSITTEEIYNMTNRILGVIINIESINRKIRKSVNNPSLTAIHMKLKDEKANKYSFNSYVYIRNDESFNWESAE